MKKQSLYILGVGLVFLLFHRSESYGQAFSSLSYSGPQTYTVGIPISTLSPSVSGGPAAPNGNTTQAFVGNGGTGATNGTGTAAYFYNPLNTAVDLQGNVYVADADNHKIRKVTPDGTVTTLAGSGLPGYADGTGTLAIFQHPSALAVDASGNVFVSDQQNHRIRKITPAGVVTTFAGSGSAGSGEGTGTGASFNSPIGLAFDATGNLYVADYSNNKIRKITPAGVVTTFAGTGTAGFSNSTALSSTFRNPMGVAFDAAGNLYVADRLNHAIRKISTGGTVTTFAGSGSAGSLPGTGTAASFNQPNNLCVDASGNVFVADQSNSTIRKITPAGDVSTFAGVAGSSSIVNGTGTVVRMTSTYGLSMDKQGNIYVAQNVSNLIRKIVTQPYNIYPILPAGLNFNNINGQITGTPTTGQSSRTYYIQAFNTTHSSAVAALSISVSTPTGITGSNDQNYITTYTPRQSGFTTEVALLTGSSNRNQVQTNIQYFDGLGRPMQNVQWQSSPTFRDVVTPIAYDAFGREVRKYLPYTATLANSDGRYVSTAITDQKNFYNSPVAGVTTITNAAFSETKFEPSPLDRVLEQGAPGAVWQPATSRTTTEGRTVVADYGTNNTSTSYTTTGFAVRLYNAVPVTTTGHEHERTLSGTGRYGAGQLYLTIAKDENWTSADGKAGTAEEYKDKEGRVVLKRIFNKTPANSIQTLSTYYVYDDLGNLSFVLPAGVSPDDAAIPDQTIMDKIAYQYRYDSRNRLIEKKLPGKGWEYMVYDKLDQLVMSQDALQRSQDKWTFLKYDALGRNIITGIITNSSDRPTMQGTVDGATSFWESRSITSSNNTGYTNNAIPKSSSPVFTVINYYDDYNIQGIANNQSASYSNMTKGLPTATKTNVLGSSNYLWTVNYYDDKGQVTKTWKQHYKGGTLTTGNYDETVNTYNFTGQLTSTNRKHYLAGTESLFTRNYYTYDHAGRKADTYQKTGNKSTTANDSVLIARNIYNEVGQLKTRSYHSTNKGTSFAETVNYTYNPRGWLSTQTATALPFNPILKYNESISGVIAQYNGNISRQEWGSKYYNYLYDKINRLTSAISSGGNNEEISYTGMGNISTLSRKLNNTLIDELTYSNDAHKLSKIVDANSSTDANYQLAGTTNYSYDVNGNMTARTNTNTATAYKINNLSGITYNHLNLPTTMSANGTTLTYTYDGAGTKLRKQYGTNSNNDYISGIQYQGGTFDFAQTEVGRVLKNGTGTDPVYLYEYTLSDHLGNGRMYFDINGGAARKIQETEYYAFGLPVNVGSVLGTENKYQYNGKEKQDELKMFDYGARFYDPVIGRWNVIDPLSEKYYSLSPYNYVANNPVRLIDADGRIIVDPTGKRITYEVNKDGSLKWSSNATKDVMRIGNAMSRTNTGLQSLSNLDKADFNVTMSINTKDLIKEANGAIRSGYSKPTVDSKGNITKYDVTVYEKGIDAVSTSPEGTRPVVMKDGERVYMDNYTKDEHIGAVGVHEARHVTDKNSRGFQNKGKDVEKDPNKDQLKYYRELDERKKQEQ